MFVLTRRMIIGDVIDGKQQETVTYGGRIEEETGIITGRIECVWWEGFYVGGEEGPLGVSLSKH